MSAPFMTIAGVRYVEAKPHDQLHPISGVCEQCAFGRDGAWKHCATAIDGASVVAFGGDCDARDVIYVKATSQEGAA